MSESTIATKIDIWVDAIVCDRCEAKIKVHDKVGRRKRWYRKGGDIPPGWLRVDIWPQGRSTPCDSHLCRKCAKARL